MVLTIIDDDESGFNGEDEIIGCKESQLELIKPILRPLSSMTNEEATVVIRSRSEVYKKVVAEVVNQYLIRFEFEYASSRRRRSTTQRFDELSADQFRYLLSKGFDLFGLIEKGEAIDATTLTQKP